MAVCSVLNQHQSYFFLFQKKVPEAALAQSMSEASNQLNATECMPLLA